MMANVTIGTGLLLTLLGAGAYAAYLGTDKQSWTALIPAFVGLPLLVLGLLARRDSLRMHAMHAAVVLALLGFLAAAGRGVPKLITTGYSPAIGVMLAMALLCGIFVALCVRSFIQARRARKAREAADGAAS